MDWLTDDRRVVATRVRSPTMRLSEGTKTHFGARSLRGVRVLKLGLALSNVREKTGGDLDGFRPPPSCQLWDPET